MCKGKLESQLGARVLVLFFCFFYISVCPNFLSELSRCHIINNVGFFNASGF